MMQSHGDDIRMESTGRTNARKTSTRTKEPARTCATHSSSHAALVLIVRGRRVAGRAWWRDWLKRNSQVDRRIRGADCVSICPLPPQVRTASRLERQSERVPAAPHLARCKEASRDRLALAADLTPVDEPPFSCPPSRIRKGESGAILTFRRRSTVSSAVPLVRDSRPEPTCHSD